MFRFLLLLCFCLCNSSLAFSQNNIKTLFQSINGGVVELHVQSLAEPQPGQVSYQAATENSLGSGAVISDSGRILTAAHVVDKATAIKVIFSDGSETSGHVVWVNPLIDLAMIQAGNIPDNLVTLPLAKSGDYQVGDQIIVIGAPYGVSHSLSVGYLSGIRDREPIPGTALTPRFLQTDAAINTGNSGGPMFNEKGEIIGIVSFILSQTGGSNGLGFVVSIDTIHHVMANDPGTFSGFIPHLLTDIESKAINNPYGYGMLVQHVMPGTMASRLGFRGGFLNVSVGNKAILLGGDILIEVAGRPLKSLKAVMKLKQELADYQRGDKIEIKYLREGEEKRVIWTIE